MKKAFITGITGQDGSYLSELLVDKGYEVHGLVRRTSNDPMERIEKLRLGHRLKLHEGNMRDLNTIRTALERAVPDEIYNLAAQSHVGTSFNCAEETWEVNYYGLGRIVHEALRVNPHVKIYQASTSEMFGNSPPPQNEKTPFDPQSPYAEAKLRAHQDFVVGTRERRNAFVLSGILFNHESPRRGKQFVTRKITHSLAKIAHGVQDSFSLGNIDVKRDWGFAGDYVKAMWQMLQKDVPDDYVIATGDRHTVREFIEIAGLYLGMIIEWEGSGESTIGKNRRTGKPIITIDKALYRPHEVYNLCGDPLKAYRMLGWRPTVPFVSLVEMMVRADYDAVLRIST